MRRPSFARQVVTVVRMGPPNRHNEREPIGQFDISHCSVTPAGSSENNDGRERVISTMTLIGPRLLDAVRTYDRIVHDGVRYQIVGDPRPWPHHTEIALKRVEG